MKTHEFKTEKGEFVIDDIDNTELLLYSVFNNAKHKSVRCGIHLQPLFSLSEVTEEEAKGVVDYEEKTGLYHGYYSPLVALHSLLNSKGIDINNGNWYLFKKV